MERKAGNNIFNFLKTGKLFGINLGVDKTTLFSLFENELILSYSNDVSEGYFLEYAELIVYNDCVQNIIVSKMQLKNVFLSSNNISYALKKRISLNKLLLVLTQLNVEWRFDKIFTDDKSICIKTEGGVSILLDFSDGYCEIDRIVI